MKVLAIIPARMGASRFPGKPLEKLLGMPMIGHCYFRAKIAIGQDNVWIATCDNEIRSYSQTIGAKAIDTSAKHTRATGRTAEALESIELNAKLKFEIILMVQADEPLVIPDDLTCMLNSFSDPRVTIVNLMCKAQTRAHFYDKNNVNVVVNNAMDALDFSREPIPSDWKNLENIPQYIQTGVFAFRREAQLHLNYLPETLHEIAESVDYEPGNRGRSKSAPIAFSQTEFSRLPIRLFSYTNRTGGIAYRSSSCCVMCISCLNGCRCHYWPVYKC